ncbi:1535_t:CDS:2 [Cetraspora pellucida]|uniref:1535_t:CDS:1 n=1 Tax=Cetraspora pellucida TaxID=1433469 RepID=A0A9N9JC87_9GLOM|nr:1535_t:CDS:2 [Cetraspora pellucida]
MHYKNNLQEFSRFMCKDEYNFSTEYITINGNQILVRRSSRLKNIQPKKYIFKRPYKKKFKILYCEKCNTFRKTKFCTKCKNKLYNVQDFDIDSINSESCSISSNSSYISDDGFVVLDKKCSSFFEDEGLRMDDSDN